MFLLNVLVSLLNFSDGVRLGGMLPHGNTGFTPDLRPETAWRSAPAVHAWDGGNQRRASNPAVVAGAGTSGPRGLPSGRQKPRRVVTSARAGGWARLAVGEREAPGAAPPRKKGASRARYAPGGITARSAGEIAALRSDIPR